MPMTIEFRFTPTTSAESNNEPQASCTNAEDFQKSGQLNKLRQSLICKRKVVCLCSNSTTTFRASNRYGANQSFMSVSPECIDKYFNTFSLAYDPFEVTNIHGTSHKKYSITLPCFSEFNNRDAMKLFVYRFYDHFDGLIGLDLLTKWEAKIDIKNRTLTTQSAINPIKMYNLCNVNLYGDIIPAQSPKMVRIPIDALDGDVLIVEQTIGNCIIQECIITVKNRRGV